MSTAAPKSLLIIDEGSLVHNRDFIVRLERQLKLSVFVRRRGRTELQGRLSFAAREAVLFLRLLVSPWAYRRRAVLLCSSGHYAALAAARIGALGGNGPAVVLYNFYLHDLGRHSLVRRVLRFLLTDRVSVAAQSRRDVAYFESLRTAAHIALVPYRQDPMETVEPVAAAESDYVFAGGYSNRDYDALLRCARRLPDVRFVLAPSRLNTLTESPGTNVELHFDLAPSEFHRLLAGARLVAIPLKQDVGASGQMVCLAAMQLGKTVVVPDFDGVAQYVESGVSGVVYAAGDEDALVSAIRTNFDDPSTLARIGKTARERYLALFTRRPYDDALLDELARLLDGAALAPVSAS